MSEERKHHDYSPSTLQSLEACPCWKSRPSQHERTIAGTLAHQVTETGKDDQRLSDEDIAAAVECMDYVAARKTLMEIARDKAVQSLAAEIWGKDLKGIQVGPDANCEHEASARIAPVIELKETYLPIDDCIFDDYIPYPNLSPDGEGARLAEHRRVVSTTAGYIDAALISHCGTYAECFDFKFGRWPVEKAEDNLQGIAYMLGLMKKFPSLQRVTFHFKQPHADLITSHTFHRDQIPQLYLRIQVVVAKAREARTHPNFSTARPMVPACNFCDNIGICPKVEEIMLKVGQKYYPLEIPEDITPSKLHDRHSTALGLRLVQVVRSWGDAYRARINDRVLRQEQDVPEGHIIHESQGDRKIVDVAKFKEISSRYLTPEEISSCAEFTFGAIEKLIEFKAPRGSKSAVLREFRAALLDNKAVERGQPFSYLRAIPTKAKNNEQPNDQSVTNT